MSTGTSKDSVSKQAADEVISWLREYAASRINSHLIDERRSIPPYVVLDFGNHGLFGLQVPRRYGGLELTQTDVVRVLAQLGAIDLTLATFLSSHANGVHTIQKYGCSALREQLLSKLASGREISAFALTEPGAGSNPRAIQTQAVQDGRGGWALNGEKYLVDSGSWASVITVFARTSENTRNSPSISAFAIRQGTPGLVIGGESLTMGMRGMVQNTMHLRDVRVPAENLLGSPGAGISISQDTLSLARLNLAAKSIGGMKRCLQLLHRYASRRRVATGMLWDNPVTQSRIVQLVSAVSVVEALVGRISSNLDAGEEVPTEAFLACKVAGSEYLWKTADALVQVMGGRGYVDTNGAPQILRDARSFLLSEGPTETLLMYLGSRVIHAGNELEQFIAVELGAPLVAGRLREVTERIRARCSNGSLAERIGKLNCAYWASSLVGEVAMWAILTAAAEHSELKEHEIAKAWAYSKFEERIGALAEGGAAEWALGYGRAAKDLIASFTESVGDVEQNLPAGVTDLDLLLRRSPTLSVIDRGSSSRIERCADGDGEACEATWSTEASLGVNVFASRKGVPEHVVFLTLLGTLVYRHTGQEHVRICLHDGSTEGLDLWMQFGGRPSLEDLLAQVIRALAAQPNHRSNNPDQGESGVRVILATTSTALERSTDAAALKVIIEGGDIRKTEWRYDGRSLGRVGAARLAARFEELLRSWIAHPEAAVSRLSMLPREERDLLVRSWNETASAYPKDSCIHQLFEQQVARAPDRVAVECDGQALSYGQLNARADRLACRLRQLGVDREVRVGLCVERSLDLLVSLLGILKAGGAYVPLDATQPRRRLTHILDETRVPVIVAHPHLAAMLPDHGAQLVHPEAGKELEAFETEDVLVEASRAEQCAYVLYTSGSTGRPKGVEICHRSVVNFLTSMRERPGFSQNDVLVAVTTISFDMAGLELFLPLVTGGRVVLANQSCAVDGVALAKLIEQSGATVLQATPATWQMLLASGWRGKPGLKALCGAESLPQELARGIQSRTGSLWNMYGPTESTIWSCVEEVTDQKGPISIGRPIANTQVYILDEELQLVPVGVVGELLIGGDGLARGYLGRPDLTGERFLPDPFRPGERIYRTGDLARFLPDGRLEHLGRLDYQVKVRGFRIELGEIETALASHRAVREAVVMAREDAPGDVRLVAYVTLSTALGRGAISELREHVREYVPEYMEPSAFVVLSNFPLTPNGKLDRHALPAPGPEDIVSEEHEEPPSSPIEEEIATIWSSTLGVATISRQHDFFALGGHSLLATQVVSRLRDAFGVEIPIGFMFEQPTIAALAQAVSDSLILSGKTLDDTSPPLVIAKTQQAGLVFEDEQRSALEPGGRSGPLALSFAQQRLWFLDQLEPGSTSYHDRSAFRLEGRLEVEALRCAFEQVVGRHEALRTRFELHEGQPVQVIGTVSSWPLPVVSLESLPEEQRQAKVVELTQAEGLHPFDLSSGPVLRTTLLRLRPEEHVLLVTRHHIASDGWSAGVLWRELSALYAALSQGHSSPLLPLPIQYADYALRQRKWLQGPVLEQQLAYWHDRLAGVPALDLPTDHPRPAVQGHRGASYLFALSAELSAALRQLSEKQHTTLFMTLLAGWQVLLSRYSGQEDFGIGFPIANRTQTDIEGLIGCFVNTLVMRADLSGNPTYPELLERVRVRALEAYTHQTVPFERLIEELGVERDLSRSPLFQVLFVLQNAPEADLALAGIELHPLTVPTTTAKFDLTLLMRDDERGLQCEIEYRTDLFEASSIARMGGHFQTLLEGIVANPEQRVSSLQLLTDAEQHQVLVEWNDTSKDFPTNKCLHQLFEEQVERTPDAIAVIFGTQRLTYRELNRRANKLARHLRDQRVSPEVLVGICVERSLEMVVGLLAILKAGGAYLPLDRTLPAERLSFILEDSRAPVVLTQDGLPGRAYVPGIKIVRLDDWSVIAQEAENDLESEARPENLAYVIYTSGSTGRPKGVAIEHHSGVTLLNWALNVFTPNQLQGVLASTSISFDLSVFEIFLPLSSGGTIIIAENALQLPELPAANLVTLINTVPSAMTELMRISGVPASVTTVNLAGEPLQNSLVRQIYKQETIQSVHNLYGPTEDTTYSTFALMKRESSEISSIGRPISNTRTYILDGNLQPVPIGVPGELHLGGGGLARGYLNRPELTAERFISNPFSKDPEARLYKTGDIGRYLPDGNIEFLGRVDQQVKVRGFRVELGEIEIVLGQHPLIEACVVVARDGPDHEKRLVAYLVAKSERTILLDELRSFLKTKLPDYMLPAAFVFLEALPLNLNGKVDRRALPPPEPSRPDIQNLLVPPRTPIEELLAGIWCEVLDLDKVGIHDNFFDLGGHSLLAIQVIYRVRERCETHLPLQAFFQAPTVAELAAELRRADKLATRMIPRQGRQSAPLSFGQQRLWFLNQLLPGTPVHNLPVAIRLTKPPNVGALEQSLNEIVRRHEALRTTISSVDGTPVQLIAAELTLALPIVDLSDFPPAQRRDQAHRITIEEAHRPFDLVRGPLFRSLLIRMSSHEHTLLMTMHHLISDGWSLGILLRELGVLYDAFAKGEASPLAPLPIQYSDFALWQREWVQTEELDRQLAYWRQQLADAPEVVELPADKPRPRVQSFKGARETLSLAADLSNDLKAFGRRQGATLFMTLLAGFNVLLHRLTGQEDILVGSPIANRPRTEVEGLIGFFLNNLVLRTRLSSQNSFREVLDRTRQTAVAAYANQSVPFERLVEELQPARDVRRTPIFQVAFNLLKFTDDQINLPGLTEETVSAAGVLSQAEDPWSLFDLTLYARERSEEIDLIAVYSTDLFEPATIMRMLRQFEVLLRDAVAQPDKPVGALSLLTAAEREALIEDFNKDFELAEAEPQVIGNNSIVGAR